MATAVYLETSIISYLAARPSRDLITAARQRLTHDWWQTRRAAFRLYVSDLVIAEARAGDPDAAERRAAFLVGLPLLRADRSATELAHALIRELRLPERAQADAIHIAIAACHGVDFLLTWNSTHIANAELRPAVDRTCRAGGYSAPALCTPDELMGA